MRTFILALVLSTATALEPTTRRRALAHVGLATLAPLDATAIPPIAIENRPPPEVTAPSSKRQLRVVEALNAKGFEVYGAYWCRYCDEQRQVLGKEGAAAVAYVECDPGGLNAAPGLCQAAKIGSYPTWAAPDGRLISGMQSLDDLEVLVGIKKKAAPAKSKAASNKPPPVLAPSSPDAIRVAALLAKSGAVFYGTYWCRYCDLQRQLFGKTAWARVPSYECDPRGAQAQPGKCAAVNVEAYPTWVVNGQTLTGVQTLAALEAALGAPPSSTAAKSAADAIVGAPPRDAKRRKAPAAEDCVDCAVDEKPRVT